MTAEIESPVTITAPAHEVETLLRSALQENERAALRVTALAHAANILEPERQGEMETARVVIEFIATSVAGGVTYDVMKKVAKVATAKFGSKNVK